MAQVWFLALPSYVELNVSSVNSLHSLAFLSLWKLKFNINTRIKFKSWQGFAKQICSQTPFLWTPLGLKKYSYREPLSSGFKEKVWGQDLENCQ